MSRWQSCPSRQRRRRKKTQKDRPRREYGIRDVCMFEDRILVSRLKKGDREALRIVYEKYKGTMLTVAAGMLGDRAAAEDVLHDVFVSFAQRIMDIRLDGNLKSYLMISVTNKVRDRFRRKSSTEVGLGERDFGAGGDDASKQVELAEDVERLREAMKRLPEEQREAIMLRAHGGLSFEEIGKAQGTNSNTARGRYRYGVEKLRSLMDGEVKK
jgi:RNA polymerase sigma-70 factor, ECF subfamily